MTVGELKEALSAGAAAESGTEKEIRGCFVCDVMSRTLWKGFRGMAWITHQANMNALAAAVMTGAACIIFPDGIEAEQEVRERAEAEKIPLIVSEKTAFELAGRLYELGLRGEESIKYHAES